MRLRSLSLLAALAAALLVGCSMLGLGQTAEPLAAFVGASRATHDVIAPRFVSYVQADETLSAGARADLVGLVGERELALGRAEEFLGASR